MGSVVLQAAYGYEVKPQNDFFIKLVEVASEPLFLAVTGGSFVEFLPILKYITGTSSYEIEEKSEINVITNKNGFLVLDSNELQKSVPNMQEMCLTSLSKTLKHP